MVLRPYFNLIAMKYEPLHDSIGIITYMLLSLMTYRSPGIRVMLLLNPGPLMLKLYPTTDATTLCLAPQYRDMVIGSIIILKLTPLTLSEALNTEPESITEVTLM